MKNKSKILVAENERIIASDIKNLLLDWGYTEPLIAGSADQILKMVKKKRPDLVIIDNRLRGNESGRQTAEMLNEKYNIAVILLSDWFKESVQSLKKAAKCFYSIPKPFDSEELKSKIQLILGNQTN